MGCAAAAIVLAPSSAAAPAAVLDYHGILGVGMGAEQEEVHAAFSALRSTGYAGSEEVREAFAVLSHPEKLQRHEELEAAVRRELGTAQTTASKAVNLALGRPTAQSSTRPGGGEPSRAVDGIVDPRWAAGSCTHTVPEGEPSPWWSVELGAVRSVGRVRLLNRLEASERLRNWQVTVGPPPGMGDGEPCGAVSSAPVGPGSWAQVDCGGRRGEFVSVSLVASGPSAVLTLCEVEVYEHNSRSGTLDRSASRAQVAAARLYADEFFAVKASPWREDRLVYLRKAAGLLMDVLEQSNSADSMVLDLLYRDAVELQGPRGQPPAVDIPELMLVRSKILERIAFSEGCRDEARCCGPSAARTAAGCLSLAISLAKSAGSLDRASHLYERGVTPSPGGQGSVPLAHWPSFWQACELYLPQLSSGSAVFGPFWDPHEPALRAMSTLLMESMGKLQRDLGQVLAAAGSGGFEQVSLTAVKHGGYERLALYRGRQGWDPRWCGPQAVRRLHICELLERRLPGESRGLADRYLLDDNEEVSIMRLLPKTRVRPHNARTNARVQLGLPLRGNGGSSIRVGGRPGDWGKGSEVRVLAYDACHDRDFTHEGPDAFYWLEVGILHPDVLEELLGERTHREL